MTPDAKTSYDQVPYVSQPFSSSHPDNLATMARLFGLSSPDVNSARVLELGCASGGNLIPMAETLPGASFHGVDLSQLQTSEGQSLVARLGLHNVVLEQRDIMDVDCEMGRFDYIICHGVYSWVPDTVREKILSICSKQLSNSGVAYISYNTYPGWHVRASVREMMNFHAGRFDTTEERIEQARSLLNFLTDAVPDGDGTYGKLLRDELNIIRDRADSYLFHEHLEEYNDPLYFHQFIKQADAHGLRYLGEASLADMLPHGEFPEHTQETLHKIAPDIIHMEQYLDFLRNRMFRRTLLCHAHVDLQRNIEPDNLLGFYVASPLVLEDPETPPVPGAPLGFKHVHGTTITLYREIEQTALLHLLSIWPEQVAVRDLVQHCLHDEMDTAGLTKVCELILNCASMGLVELHQAPARFKTRPSTHPAASPLARLQAGEGDWVTNRRHESVELDAFAREVLMVLDGNRDLLSIESALMKRIGDGALTVKREDEALTNREELSRVVHGSLNEKIAELANAALLR